MRRVWLDITQSRASGSGVEGAYGTAGAVRQELEREPPNVAARCSSRGTNKSTIRPKRVNFMAYQVTYQNISTYQDLSRAKLLKSLASYTQGESK